MMSNAKNIVLHWLSPDAFSHSQGARRFALPARFDHQGENWMDDAWSLVIETTDMPDATGHQSGTARFLVQDAPQEWLSEGRGFTLLAGDLVVAEGRVEKTLSS